MVSNAREWLPIMAGYNTTETYDLSVNYYKAMLTPTRREHVIQLVKSIQVDKSGLSPQGWLVRSKSVPATLHFDEFQLDRSGSKFFQMAFTSRDALNQTKGCLPLYAHYPPKRLRFLMTRVVNAPNSCIRLPRWVQMDHPEVLPTKFSEETYREAPAVATFVRQMMDRREKSGVVVCRNWHHASALIESFRPWDTELPVMWWERSRTYEVNVFRLPGAPEVTLLFIPGDVEVEFLEEIDAVLTLHPNPTFWKDLKPARKALTQVSDYTIDGFTANVVDAQAQTSLQKTDRNAQTTA